MCFFFGLTHTIRRASSRSRAEGIEVTLVGVDVRCDIQASVANRTAMSDVFTTRAIALAASR